MDSAAREYIDRIAPGNRALFDRIHRLILEEHPGATVGISYQMPAYTVGQRRLYVGAWKHGVSLYGWQKGQDAGFTARHPELRTGKGTIQLRADDAGRVPDEELRELVRAALSD